MDFANFMKHDTVNQRRFPFQTSEIYEKMSGGSTSLDLGSFPNGGIILRARLNANVIVGRFDEIPGRVRACARVAFARAGC
jgi:hypothetical protein